MLPLATCSSTPSNLSKSSLQLLDVPPSGTACRPCVVFGLLHTFRCVWHEISMASEELLPSWHPFWLQVINVDA